MKRILFVLLVDFATVGLGLVSILFTKSLIDQVTVNQEGFHALGFALMIAAHLLNLGFGAFRTYLYIMVSERFCLEMRMSMYLKILRGRWRQVAALHTGDWTTRMGSDVEVVSNGIAEIIPSLLTVAMGIGSSFFLLYHYEPVLALAALVIGPVSLLFSVFYRRRLSKLHVRIKENDAHSQSFLQESLANIAILKAFEQELSCEEKLWEIRRDRFKILRERGKLNIFIRIGTGLFFSLAYMIAFGWGLYRMSTGSVSFGTMTVFLSLSSQIQSQIMSLQTLVPKCIAIFASAGRIMEADELERELAPGFSSLEGPLGIRIQGLSFAYGEDTILSNASFDVKPGDRLAVIGESGAGKTTLARLLLGLVEPTEGGIYLYNEKGGTQSTDSRSRASFCYVAQGNTLMSGTIRENLRIGDDKATDEEMREALRYADADFVFRLPKELDTVLTESGGTISEGEAQRIAIARALLRKRPILILDEASSALDLNTEETIISKLNELPWLSTCIVISHRPSPIRICNRCCRIQDGVLVEVPRVDGSYDMVRDWLEG